MAYLGPIEAARVALLLPRFVARLTQLMDNFEKRTGKKTVVVSGRRGNDEQARIYADSVRQGFRASPPGRSKHQYAAADLNIIGETSGDAARDQRNPHYAILAEEARKLGLKTGFDFKGGLPDPYHIEDAAPIAQLAEEHAAFLRRELWRLLAAVALAAVAIGAAIAVHRTKKGS